MGSPLEIILVIAALSLWFLFPIGMFLSVSHVDKNTDQIFQLEKLRNTTMPKKRKKVKVTSRSSILPNEPLRL